MPKPLTIPLQLFSLGPFITSQGPLSVEGVLSPVTVVQPVYGGNGLVSLTLNPDGSVPFSDPLALPVLQGIESDVGNLVTAAGTIDGVLDNLLAELQSSGAFYGMLDVHLSDVVNYLTNIGGATDGILTAVGNSNGMLDAIKTAVETTAAILTDVWDSTNHRLRVATS
jgi:hypothetical protein